ncbi:hypothetical protein F3J44_01740 [Pantoea sp. Tr-811]|uniref:lectin MOA-related protein n=1 Tax=Pantoea sp. Tr-811 TaxID=2608361 RepID=UPI001423D136|nr:lectin MOA-related protein [Pantoea sp. Tr-811]NIF25096.1 hypothetical protein [Pantoea sp. Tr-811]
MPIHKLVANQPHDLSTPIIGQVIPAPEPDPPPPEPNLSEKNQAAGELSDALRLKHITEEDRLALRDQHGRWLCVHRRGYGDWGWAYLGDPDTYSADIVPLRVRVDSARNEMVLCAELDVQDWSLFANGDSSKGEYVFAGWKAWESYPHLTFKVAISGNTVVNEQEVPAFTLGVKLGTSRMVLNAPGGSWGWLKLSPVAELPTAQVSRFSLHKLLVPVSKVAALIKETWPAIDLGYRQFAVDRYYEAISDQHARAIWYNSGLASYRFTPEVFDCDDFSLAYKSQASKDAYERRALYPYAVGIVFGSNDRGAHSANLFIDQQGRLRLIEPQNRNIHRASEWNYRPFFVML